MNEPELVHWDWKDQAPMGKIAAIVERMSLQGRVFMREVPDQGDCYMWVISDHEVSEDELTELLAR